MAEGPIQTGHKQAGVPTITTVDPSVNVHTFEEKILNTDVHFQITKLCDSFHLWLGKSGHFGEVSVAMTMKGFPASSTVLIGGQASPTVSLAERLSKRTGKQVFVSGDLDSFDQLAVPLVEQRIAEEMKLNPDKF